VSTYNPGLEADLNSILTILGVTKTSLWPFWEKTGTLVSGIGVGDLTASETAGAAEALEDDFSPLLLPCGLYSYHFHPTGDHHLAGIDNAAYSFPGAAFSVGCWIRPNAIASNVMLAMYDSAGLNEEWRFWIDAAGKLDLELHDASASASEIAISDSALTLNQWVWVVATYDGTSATPDVWLYVNGAAVNDGSTTETGAFVAMEDTGSLLTVGCGGVTATPTTEFHGRMAMPFICGKELTAAQVLELYGIMQPMVGIV
jgi:hypothetical protein